MRKRQPELFMLIGDPVEGTLSPLIFNTAFRRLGMNAIYAAVRVPPSILSEFVFTIRRAGIRGFNVTIPHKVAIIELLDSLNESAKEVEAVNTVVNEDGKLIGYNTDGRGALMALEKEIGSVNGKRVLLLGAGGAARAVAFSLAKAGCELTIANRTLSKAEALAEIISKKLGKSVGVISLDREKLREEISRADILVNTTSVGMMPNVDETLVTSDLMHKNLVVYDIVYKPLKTRLLKEAEKVGARTVNGLGMLINQAAIAFKIWTGKDAPVEDMKRAVQEYLEGKR
ncbi:MAG: shikimate dehydrogenase [Candidatus Hadarchaeales archaeon]